MGERREWLVVPSLIILACVVAFAWVLHGLGRDARALVENEDGAVEVLRLLEKAQHARKITRGEFAWLTDLELSSDLTTARDDIGPHVLASGYRFDVLLPAFRQSSPIVELVTQDAGKEHPELRRKHFVIVARPQAPGLGGYRTFYLDDTGLIWISEGVSDEEILRRNPLPLTHLGTSEGKDASGRSWVRLDTLVPRGQREWERK